MKFSHSTQFRDKILTFSYHERILYSERETEVIPISTELSPEDYKKAQEFIKRMKPLLATGDITIAPTQKNIEFDRLYSFPEAKKIDVIKSLSAEDCYQIEPNNNQRFGNEDVYKFFKEIVLLSYGDSEPVKLYLKMYIHERPRYDTVVVISFHEEGWHEI